MAIEVASEASEWIVLNNPDVFAEPRRPESLLVRTVCNPGFDVFGCMLVNATDSTQLDGAGVVYHVSGLV